MIKDFKHFKNDSENLENDPYGEEIWNEDEDINALLNVDIIGGEHRFLNYYECDRCGTAWQDEWDAMCDDECPECGAVMTPYESEDLEI